MILQRRALLVTAFAATGCATLQNRPAILGRWRQTQTQATFTFEQGGIVDVRDRDGYPPPPPVHTGWSLIWRARADGDFELAYDGMPDRVVAVAHLRDRRMELRYSATNMHVFERIADADPIVGWWRDVRYRHVYIFLDGGRGRFRPTVSSGEDPTLSAVLMPEVTWRRWRNAYEITLRTAGIDGGFSVDSGVAHIRGGTLHTDIRQQDGMLTLEKLAL